MNATVMRTVLVGAVLLAGGLAAVGARMLYDRAEELHRGYVAPEVFVEIAPGTSIREIGRQLVEARVVRDERTFQIAFWRGGNDRLLQAGEYRFAEPASALDVVDMLARGQVHLHNITFPEGLTRTEMAELFGRSSFGTPGDFLAASARRPDRRSGPRGGGSRGLPVSGYVRLAARRDGRRSGRRDAGPVPPGVRR